MIGADLAQAIALEIETIKPPRPITHDLLKSVLDALGVNLLDVLINDLRDGTYYALLHFDATPAEIDARPSDAIALAIRCGAPIYVAESVLAEAGVVPQDEEEIEEEEEESYEDAVPASSAAEPERPKTLREILQGKLEEAVRQEDYERAAQIRDEIERLENQA
jgi:bifunctional DNase/RNase